ncbi:hypothetical protein [Nitrogeniibacter aestuarii]|uniref:hypothetical protein n=1 Tax=Nitrogeniibacter aestuarii TaxID=2815343 RepID=UPI001D10BE84|nr:hypothetical protein [Nitrogeniibacter aestuarii]
MDELSERRLRQRILVNQGEDMAFKLFCEGTPADVADLSLEGFAMRASTAPDASHEFSFRLEYRDMPVTVTGQAQVVNYQKGATHESGMAGCRILSFDRAGRDTLAMWLSVHVARLANVPLSADEALDIVAGPSLV